MSVARVRIEEGCISCNLCEDLAPEVFEVPVGETCTVREGWRERVSGKAEREAALREAAESCPVEVIVLDGEA